MIGVQNANNRYQAAGLSVPSLDRQGL